MFPQQLSQMKSNNSNSNDSRSRSSSHSSSSNLQADGHRSFFVPSVLFDISKIKVESDKNFIHHRHQQMQQQYGQGKKTGQDQGEVFTTSPSSCLPSTPVHSSLQKALAILNGSHTTTNHMHHHHQHGQNYHTKKQQQ
mmetsp:Transcript_25952/g.29144  ORF Transcript_25952/g.29144 Transcript_25952/m.29144 type:complete len:138 (+) Transcript_25952:27-440(+)